ncbi:conserved hypothetical protein [uncultured Dysgonomonas sp.]|uniref:Uncharacterized protein n=1 Tax=uncultured Dysgonomonas sp. TaxID=206096 RepID=A0A212JVH1_9BACT|nr:conserved hypothetical protein [uncultured Dysgonomonas sp.]
MPFLFSMSFVEEELLKGDKSDTFYPIFLMLLFFIVELLKYSIISKNSLYKIIFRIINLL